MQRDELPSGELEALERSLLAALVTGAGNHTRATFHADLEDTIDKQAIDSTRGGTLESAEPDADARGPFQGGRHFDPLLALFRAAVAAKHSLFLVHYDFTLEAGAWRFRLKLQSLAEYEKMCSERRVLDDAIATMMIAAAGEGWTRIVLARSDVSPLLVLRLLGYYAGNERRELPVPAELGAKVAELWTFHRERGFGLDSITYNLRGGARKKERGFIVYYGALLEKQS